jgi:hypothetical protein
MYVRARFCLSVSDLNFILVEGYYEVKSLAIETQTSEQWLVKVAAKICEQICKHVQKIAYRASTAANSTSLRHV